MLPENVAIRAEGLSKEYHIGALQNQNLTFQEQVVRAMAAPVRRIGGLLRGHATAAADLNESFWALRDVSFSIEKGEVVGIIGRNGAGKSTLLKLLSRITEPTCGSAMIRGRVGSLLEVGTGFHTELTGRENVYLNGSILGMRRDEVRSKFEEIVEFSEIGKFIDTPVKHYSSGMKVRLAFSVAAHLEPEVLFVDEVLAVGDAAFRKKCTDKVSEVGRRGATVLVVSHNAQAVTSLCERVLWLQQGQLVADGPAASTVVEYLSQSVGLGGERVWNTEEASGGEICRMRAVRVRNERGELTNHIDVRESFCIEAEVEVLQSGHGIVVKNDLFNADNSAVFGAIDTRNPTWSGETWDAGVYRVRMWVPGNLLQVDTYPVGCSLWAWSPERVHQFGSRDVVCVHVTDSASGPNATAGFTGQFPGSIRPVLDWDSQRIDGGASPTPVIVGSRSRTRSIAG